MRLKAWIRVAVSAPNAFFVERVSCARAPQNGARTPAVQPRGLPTHGDESIAGQHDSSARFHTHPVTLGQGLGLWVRSTRPRCVQIVNKLGILGSGTGLHMALS